MRRQQGHEVKPSKAQFFQLYVMQRLGTYTEFDRHLRDCGATVTGISITIRVDVGQLEPVQVNGEPTR